MTTEAGLLDAIWEQPHDDVPRLVYADWLDDAGGDENAARAELIRVQVELARIPGDDPRFDSLEARERELLKKWEKAWWKAMPKGCRKGSYHRGFPILYLGAFAVKGMVKLGEERMRITPLSRYHYRVHGTDLDALLGWPWLHRLDLFALRPPVPDDWVERLAGTDNLRNVSELALLDIRLSSREASHLLDAWAGRHLATLNIAAAEGHGNDLAAVLAKSPTLKTVRGLDVSESDLTPDALAALLKSPQLERLIDLRISHNPLGEAGMRALLAWPGLRHLRWLCLSDLELTDPIVVALAGCPPLGNMRTLLLSGNRIGHAGVKALAESPHLERLEHLYLYDNPLTKSPDAVKILRKRFGKRVSGLPDR